MKVTQLFNPFNCQVPSYKVGLWTVIIVLAVIGGIGYFLFKRSKSQSGFDPYEAILS